MKNIKNIFRVMFVLMILSLLVLTSCSNRSPVDPLYDQQVVEDKEIDLVVTSVKFNGVLYPLQEGKVPEPEGINVNIKTAGYFQSTLHSLASNKPTIGILSNIEIGIAQENGEEFKVLTPYYREIVGPDGTTMGQVVAKKGSNLLPENFEGKRIGIQGESDGSTIAMMNILRKAYQVDLSKVEFVVVESNMAPILVNEGKLDAAMFDSDYILTDSFSQHYETVLDFNKESYEFYGTVPPASFFVVKKSLYDMDPNSYNKVITYFSECYNWYRDNVEEVSRMEAEDEGESYELVLLKSKYEERAGNLIERDVSAFNDFYETAKLRGLIQEVPNVYDLFVYQK